MSFLKCFLSSSTSILGQQSSAETPRNRKKECREEENKGGRAPAGPGRSLEVKACGFMVKSRSLYGCCNHLVLNRDEIPTAIFKVVCFSIVSLKLKNKSAQKQSIIPGRQTACNALNLHMILSAAHVSNHKSLLHFESLWRKCVYSLSHT